MRQVGRDLADTVEPRIDQVVDLLVVDIGQDVRRRNLHQRDLGLIEWLAYGRQQLHLRGANPIDARNDVMCDRVRQHVIDLSDMRNGILASDVPLCVGVASAQAPAHSTAQAPPLQSLAGRPWESP